MRFLTSLALLAIVSTAQAQAPDSAPPVPKGAYEIDKSHASIIFRVDHVGFSMYTGRFTRFDAKLEFDPARLGASRVNVTIDPRSIEADNAPSGFMETLSGKDWLDAANFPEMIFRSTRIEVQSADTFRIHGDLTLHGMTKPIELDARYNGGYAGHPMDPRARIGFSAKGSLKRSDFGITIGIPAPGTKMGVGDAVEVILEAEFSGPPLPK